VASARLCEVPPQPAPPSTLVSIGPRVATRASSTCSIECSPIRLRRELIMANWPASFRNEACTGSLWFPRALAPDAVPRGSSAPLLRVSLQLPRQRLILAQPAEVAQPCDWRGREVGAPRGDQHPREGLLVLDDVRSAL